MKTKIKILWKRLLGYKYLVNDNSMEIHKLNNIHKNCHVPIMNKENTKYIRKSYLKYFLRCNYNGCRWCFKEKHID